MKRFISTEFLLSLQEASLNGTEPDAETLRNRYDGFAMLLFSACAAPADRAACYNSLVYTRAELAGLTKVSGEKWGMA